MSDSETLIKAIYSAYNRLLAHRTQLDMINVFPVADSDTGSNMTRTMMAGAQAVKYDKQLEVAEILQKCSRAMLRNARGNSGVILSVLFKGFSDCVREENGLNAAMLAHGFDRALSSAARVLSNPVYEGTILSIVTAAANAARGLETQSFPLAWQTVTDEAWEALARTRFTLDALKKAEVVDSGANGLCLIFDAVNETLGGRSSAAELSDIKVAFRKAAQPKSIDYTYCTEFIINRTNSFPVSSLERELQKIGDSVAVVEDDRIIKVHLHTNVPNHAIGFALRFGALTDIKIDNMLLGQRK